MCLGNFSPSFIRRRRRSIVLHGYDANVYNNGIEVSWIINGGTWKIHEVLHVDLVKKYRLLDLTVAKSVGVINMPKR